jgi:HK97 family phage major capsid protein
VRTEEIELRRQIGAALDESETILTTAIREQRGATPEEDARVASLAVQVEEWSKPLEQFRSNDTSRALLESLPGVTSPNGAIRSEDVGEKFLRSEQFEDFARKGFRGQMDALELDGVSLRSLIDNVTATSGAAFTQPMLQSQVPLSVPDRALKLIDLLPHGTTGDNSVIYIQDTTTSVAGDTAVETAEGGAKPETTETFTRVNDTVATIPTWMNITRQAAADHPQLVSYLQGRMMYRIRRRFDNQVINGDGTGANLLGLLNRSGIVTYAPGTAEARVFSVRKAVTLIEQYDLEPDTLVLNPSDLEKFDLLLASGSGEFLAERQTYARLQTAWGLTPVTSNAIAAGTALVLDKTSAMIWDRQQPVMYLTDSHASNFTSNILTMLVELRAAISLFQPKGVAKITFNGTT